MTNKEAFLAVLDEINCILNRKNCNKDCSNCAIVKDMNSQLESLDYVESILRARDPELYFVNEIEHLQSIIEIKEKLR